MRAVATPTERSIAAGDVRLMAREWPGDGPAVLLLHGLASSSRILDLLAPQLASSFRVVAYDQRGHGRSTKPDRRYGFDHVAGDALAVIRAFRLDRPVLVGHSWGANVALEVAARWPRRVAGAVLIDGGFLSLRDEMDWRTARTVLAPPPLAGMRVEDFLAMARSGFEGRLTVTPEVEAAVLSIVRVDREGRIRPRLSLRHHLRILRALWEQDTLALLRGIRVPTLVLATRVRGPRPEEVPFLEAKRAASHAVRAIGAPVAFEWIEGIHDIPLQRPEALARRIGRFVSDLGRRTPGPTRARPLPPRPRPGAGTG